MGDGKNLKELLKEKNTSVKELSLLTGIKPSTLYSCIKCDSNIRFDNALRIANVLNVAITDICTTHPFASGITEDEIYPTIKDKLGILDNNRVKVYINASLMPLMKLYGKNELPEVDKLLTYFYMLNDQCREEVVDFLMFKLNKGKDPKREEEVKSIKTW